MSQKPNDRPSLDEQKPQSEEVRQFIRGFPLKWEGETVFTTNATYFPLRPVLYLGAPQFTAMVTEGHALSAVPSEVSIHAVPMGGELHIEGDIVCVGQLNRPSDDLPVLFFAALPKHDDPKQMISAAQVSPAERELLAKQFGIKL